MYKTLIDDPVFPIPVLNPTMMQWKRLNVLRYFLLVF